MALEVDHRAQAMPAQLSGGEQQRVAIIVVTHDETIIPTFRRIYAIRGGCTQEEAGEGRPL